MQVDLSKHRGRSGGVHRIGRVGGHQETDVTGRHDAPATARLPHLQQPVQGDRTL